MHLTKLLRFWMICFCGLVLFYSTHANETKHTHKEAEATIKKIGEYMIEVLSNRALTQDDKEEKFRILLRQDFDLKAIGEFTLGRYKAKFKAADNEHKQSAKAGSSPLEQFHKDFEELIVEMYASQFGNYKDQKFSVDHSTNGPDGAVFVYSTIIRTDGPPIEIVWRLFKIDSQYKVMDAIVAKVSMSMSQRREFAEIFQKCQRDKSGQIPCFLTEIRKQAEHFDKIGNANAENNSGHSIKTANK